MVILLINQEEFAMQVEQRNRIRLHLEYELVSLNNVARLCRFPLVCPDENELASRVAEQDLDNILYNRLWRRMGELRWAMSRLEDNDYEVCGICGEAIDFLRLMAAPASRLCVHCQEELDDRELRSPL
jgi:DnaK suppressor protein